ncbi:MAG: sugar phosphate isomerase/epimerase [Armatimonadota bacterium]|nr:sugar phosphate isomerase/epimerase [Armatimonadota bacterium]
MESIAVGCVPITWGKWRREAPEAWPEERILREVAQAGYEGVSSGPRPGKTARDVAQYLAEFGLKPAPGYLGGEFWKAESRDDSLEKAKRHAAFAREVGLSELFVAPSGGDYVSRASGKTRWQLAGHVGPEDGLTDDEYKRLAETLNEMGRATLAAGVRICIHNHVGQVIETRAEVDRLFALVDRSVVFLGPDTGHLAWGGADVVQFFRDYALLIKTMHLKDIDEAVRQRGRTKEWDYGTFTANGIFAELGEGCIDFPELFRIVNEAGFQGWVLAETDVTQKASALESVTISRNYLRHLGL